MRFNHPEVLVEEKDSAWDKKSINKKPSKD